MNWLIDKLKQDKEFLKWQIRFYKKTYKRFKKAGYVDAEDYREMYLEGKSRLTELEKGIELLERDLTISH